MSGNGLKLGDRLNGRQVAVLSEGMCPICLSMGISNELSPVEDNIWGCTNEHYFAHSDSDEDDEAP